MAFDRATADRLRAAVLELSLDECEALSERRMFGGLCICLNGKMLAGVQDERLVVRLGSEELQTALVSGRCKPMDFTGRALSNFAYVEPNEFSTEATLMEWLEMSLRFVRSAPSRKRPSKARA